MKRTTLLTICVILLLLLNLGTLAILFINSNGHGPGPGPHGREPRDIVISRLDFDSSQREAYEQLIHRHRQAINGFDRQIRSSKNELYRQLLLPVPNKRIKDSLMNSIALTQQKIEATHFNHFEEIRKLCRKDQYAQFDSLTKDLSAIFSRPPGPPRHED